MVKDLDILKEIEGKYNVHFEREKPEDYRYFSYEIEDTYIISLNIYINSSEMYLEIVNLLSQMLELKSLYLDGTDISDLSVLKQINKLTSLRISSDTPIDISGLTALTQMLDLDLSIRHLSDISVLKSLVNLNSLRLYRNHLSDISPLKQLKQLKQLEIEDNLVENIYPLIGLKQLNSLILRENLITDISPLQQLHQLTYLDLDENPISDISYLSRLTQLTSLSLSNNKISNISPLKRLINLTSLYLGRNQISDISPLSDLDQLTDLYIDSNEIDDISILSKLKNLEDLDLGHNKITDISVLANLTNITTLNIQNNFPIDILHISNLSKITSLELAHCMLSDIQPLNALLELELLDLSNNLISNIDALKSFPDLTSLHIGDNKLSDITVLVNNKKLTYLSLNNNLIYDISALSELKELTYLNIHDNQISDISPLKDLEKVNELDVSSNKIEEISFLLEMVSIKSLNLSKNLIKSLTDKILEWEIIWDNSYKYNLKKQINLEQNPLSDPPIEILKQGKNTIQRYFSRKELEEFSSIHEAKLILVGDGAAGKTSLQRRLIDENIPLPTADKRTRGIEICNWSFKDGFVAHIWDFGGQDVYYPVHRFFLTENSVFVLLASTRKEQHNFDYWIPTIFQFGGCSPIIIGQTCHDGNIVSWNDINNYISEPCFNIIKSKGLPYFELNLVHENKGLNDIKQEIIHQLTCLPHCNKDIPKSWINIRGALEEESKKTPCISYDRFKEICENVSPQTFIISLDFKDCSSFLHNIGVILWYSNNKILKDWIILRPDWAMHAVYKIIDDEIIQHRRGHIISSDFNRLWDDESYEGKHSILKQMLEVFRVAFPKKHMLDDYIIPARLFSIPSNKQWGKEPCLKLEYEYPFMPRGILNQVSAELSRYIILSENDEDEVWNNAVNFIFDDTYCQVEEFFFEKKIVIKAKGKDARGLAMVIMNALDCITDSYKGVIPKIYVPCTCSECKKGEHQSRFSYSDLQRFSKKERKDVYCNESGDKLIIDDLLYNAGFLQQVNLINKKMEKQILTIRVFLASSSELEVDRKEFELFINRENKELIKRGLFLHLEIWEDFLDSISKTRLQDEYNDAVKASDIFISLFFSKAGIFTEEEFDTAYGQFLDTGKPYVYTFFKDAPINTSEINSSITSLLNFKTKLKNLNHFPTAYTSIEDLKLKFRKQLDKLLPEFIDDVPF
ncbi:leucine-rich repeat domain-containing protein [Dysgonomonas sp. HGC4]|uniref:leucine-rich repeat domain-containing protein n=1 Tax=Dysgonomonas sp. HGC4 TaxID=1658009 RepID=UPI000680E764|nr:leucine-rich repeat domain-containing protein [Dysgonomonas sp. HGC4]MBD8349289.1 leucine-rich repeat domain-containing protein [Dysgonomonas sp. HGC4]